MRVREEADRVRRPRPAGPTPDGHRGVTAPDAAPVPGAPHDSCIRPRGKGRGVDGGTRDGKDRMRRSMVPLALVVAAAAACSSGPRTDPETLVQRQAAAGVALDTAVFAGGCFWCVEEAFDKAPGVVATTSGYTGGTVPNPTYEQVSGGGTGHVEVVRVIYDPARIGYPQLLDVFWRNVDPLTANRQFCDGGAQYRSAIFYQDAAQQRLAEESLAALEASGRFDQPIVTEVNPGAPFYVAEEYHQDYYQKNPLRYRYYKTSCGRERRLNEVWGEG